MGIVISEEYRSGIYYERNRELINNSSELICFWDGKSGGTKYTVDYATANDRLLLNMF